MIARSSSVGRIRTRNSGDEADDIGVGMAEAFENLCDNLEGPESTMWKV
jgi:hypothetical protein